MFLLPPGLNASNVYKAKIGMELDAKDGSQTPYDVWVMINGKEIGRIRKDILYTNYEFGINSSYLSYATAGSSVNRYSILNSMPHQYRTYISNIKVLMCLNKLQLYICAKNQQQAEDIAWRVPWIYKQSRELNVTIIEPTNGANLTLGSDTTIKAKVIGNGSGEKYNTVIARFNNSQTIVTLVNNGKYEDGVYAANWIPDAPKPGDNPLTEITVTASNCATTGSARTSVKVNSPEPNTTSTGNGSDSDGKKGTYVVVRKSFDPEVLDSGNIDSMHDKIIKYTIEVIPLGGISPQNVEVIDNLPNYISINNSTLRDRAKVQLNHDGRDWSTTNITWALGDLYGPRRLSFDGVFHWRLPADAQHLAGAPLPISVVTYTDSKGVRNRAEIPEGEIKIESQSSQTTTTTSSGPKTPGFEAILSVAGLVASFLALRRR